VIWLCDARLYRASVKTYWHVGAYLLILAAATWLTESPPEKCSPEQLRVSAIKVVLVFSFPNRDFHAKAPSLCPPILVAILINARDDDITSRPRNGPSKLYGV
jgi:hypothetical protein